LDLIDFRWIFSYYYCIW